MAGGKVGTSGITCLKIWSLSREGIMVRRVDENDVQTSVCSPGHASSLGLTWD